jgi:pentapeptide repeat protein
MNATVTAAAIGVGGSVIVALAAFWANVRNTKLAFRAVALTEQGQVTDRFTKAIEQLGSDKLDVRIGAVYALERVAHDSSRDHLTVMEVLSAFAREHSREQWPPAEPGADPPERATRPDMHAAVIVIGRRNRAHDQQSINLGSIELRRALLAGTDLANTFLVNATLTSANLASASLADAYLIGATLTRAYLGEANLTGANLASANLTDADLRSADLTGADLRSADFTRANLTDAVWPQDVSVPQGWARDPDSGRLSRG